MLHPHEIQALSEDIIRLYVAIEDDLLVNIAKRFDVLDDIEQGTVADWQMQKLQQMGALRQENIKTIKRASTKTAREIDRIITEGGYKALNFDEQIYKKAFSSGLLVNMPVPAQASPVLQQIIKGAIDNTRGYFNLINTTALESAQENFLRTINQVYLETSAGITDYNTAMRKAVRQLADQGITGANYISAAGRHTRNQLDVAVRRAIVTSTSQTAGRMQIQRARDWGSNLVEVTSHAASRPSHAVWQGQIYDLGSLGVSNQRDTITAVSTQNTVEGKRYPDFASSTGYGTVQGLCGANCNHHFYPFFEGISEQAYKPYPLDQNERQYEQSQQQRKLEREIREQKRRVLTADAANDAEGKVAAQFKLKEKEAALKQHLDATGRTQRAARQQVLGFGHSQASQAVWAQRKRQ